MRQQSKADAAFKKEFPYLTDKERFLIGWPGYRTRPDKSGLAYMDTYAEMSHMQGRMLHWLLTGKFITHNPVYLFLMFFVGLIWSWPLIPIIGAVFNGEYVILFVLIVGAPNFLVGVLLLVSVANCVFGNTKGESITGEEA